MNPIQRALEVGQSLWLDYIRRDLIESGELADLVSKGEIRGVTSNPTIFEHAINNSDLYTPDVRAMGQAGWKAPDIFDVLAINDIRAATDVFLPLYEETNGGDGYVSIEVNPRLADDTSATLKEARRLWRSVNRPNVMIKIPATKAGVPAISTAIEEGINVNVTLIFSLERYAEVMDAYLIGLEARREKGASLDHLASVASFFISRVDSEVDARLEEIMRKEGQNAERAANLSGKAAIANAKVAYAQFEATFSSPRFLTLAENGAHVQRPLWASTSTKNPAYVDTYYVDNLVGPDTVNTVPFKTLDAFRDHGTAEIVLGQDLSVSLAQLEALEALGISMEEVTAQLEREGVSKFADSYGSLIKSLRNRSRALGKETLSLSNEIQQTLDSLADYRVGERLWKGDSDLWSRNQSEAEEIRNRLGWLTLPQEMLETVGELETFAADVKEGGFDQVVLIGMGGSSLAPEVMHQMIASDRGLPVNIIDSTDPMVVKRIARKAPAQSTLYIIASKSGGTFETLLLFEYFWSRAVKRLGKSAGDHFVAITDPGSRLESLAIERGFRRVFHGKPEVGGRYSALSAFGLVPAALMGVDLQSMLISGMKMAQRCGPANDPILNPGLFLGAVLGAAGRNGRNKLTFVADPALEPFVVWLEQLIAESTGKSGKGLVPVAGEPSGAARSYGDDRLLVYLRQDGSLDRRYRGWVRSQIPVVVFEMQADESGLGRAFYQWEFAIAVASHLLGVNAFNQPDVQRAKEKTVELLRTFEEKGILPEVDSVWEDEGIILRSQKADGIQREMSIKEVIAHILSLTKDLKTIHFLMFISPKKSEQKRWGRVRRSLRDNLGLTTTLGTGPRYLHSTGQLHKGGPADAIYCLITTDRAIDVPVPGKEYTFGVVNRAQAIGDLQSLLGLGRRAFHFDLKNPSVLTRLLEALQEVATEFEK